MSGVNKRKQYMVRLASGLFAFAGLYVFILVIPDAWLQANPRMGHMINIGIVLIVLINLICEWVNRKSDPKVYLIKNAMVIANQLLYMTIASVCAYIGIGHGIRWLLFIPALQLSISALCVNYNVFSRGQ